MDSNTNAITPNPNPATSAPPPLQPSLPPLIPSTGAPPPLPGARRRDSSPLRKVISFLLSLCLALFIAHGFVSLLDDCLILFLHAHVLGGLRGIAFLFAIVAGIGIYALMGLTPMIPKRLFLPVSLFNPLAGLAIIPFLIYFYNQAQWISWIVSLVQVVVGLAILFWLRANALQRTHSPARAAERQPSDSLSPGAADQVSVEKKSDPGRGEGGLSSKSIFPAQENKTADLPLFPLVQEQQLNPRAFSWLNLSAFVVINFFILFPAALIYLFFCASLAVNHLSQGFLSLQPQGFTVQVRKYVRKDGKMIQLVPMAHVGDAQFYRNLTQSFPSNSIILMEGVTDDQNLLTNKVSYKRMARTMGLAEQHEEFQPVAGEWVRADVDVGEFAPTTIDLLNIVMLVHAKGVSLQTLMPLLTYSPPPAAQEQVWDDLLRKRNRRVLKELKARLPESDYLIIPWGAAHMPGIAREIQDSGFQLAEKQNYKVITFGRRH